MKSTGSGVYKGGIDFSGLMFGAIKKPVQAQLDQWEWIKWPYWNYVFIGAGIVILILILLWWYANWIR